MARVQAVHVTKGGVAKFTFDKLNNGKPAETSVDVIQEVLISAFSQAAYVEPV